MKTCLFPFRVVKLLKTLETITYFSEPKYGFNHARSLRSTTRLELFLKSQS